MKSPCARSSDSQKVTLSLSCCRICQIFHHHIAVLFISLVFLQTIYLRDIPRIRRWLHGNISARQTELKKAPIAWNISVRAQTEIGSKPRQEFVDSLCCFGKLHLPTSVNYLFSPGWNLLHVITSSVFKYFIRRLGWNFSLGWKSPCIQPLKVKCLYLHWITLSATWAVLPRGPVRATPHGSSVTMGGNRSIGRKPAMLGRVKLDNTLLTFKSANIRPKKDSMATPWTWSWIFPLNRKCRWLMSQT